MDSGAANGVRDLEPQMRLRQVTMAPSRLGPRRSRSDAYSSPAFAPHVALEARGGQPGIWPGDRMDLISDATASWRQVSSQPEEQTMIDEWPLSSLLELGALPGAVACARLHARLVLWEWGLSTFSENAELLVSELMTNATKASLSSERILPVVLWLSSDRSRLLIEVQDTSRFPPAPTGGFGGTEESGRGLLIVEAISTKWGWESPDGSSGKVVWALME
jgi:anti-sigma regulatory factor (Ser/Thr protein kinase)